MPGKERHGGLLHPDFNYISVWEFSNVANGSSIADDVYTRIGVRDGIDHGLNG